jgi:hypothetical protein
MNRYNTPDLDLANTPTEVNKIALSQVSKFRRCGVVLSCVSSCEREAWTNNETNVTRRLRNLRATTPQLQHIRCSLLCLQWATPGCTHQCAGKNSMHVQFWQPTTSPLPSEFDTLLGARRLQHVLLNPGLTCHRIRSFGPTLFWQLLSLSFWRG